MVDQHPYSKTRERFLRETRDHEMRIVRDDGDYRHLRFADPESSFYWYDIVTWPGRTVVTGDAGDWMFCRSWDLFEKNMAYGISADHWASKLLSGSGGRSLARRYSPEAFEAELLDWAARASEDWGMHEDVYPSLLREALRREVLDPSGWSEYGTYGYEEEARETLARLETEGILPCDTWEWDLREYDWSFLWCCWAIVEGIKRYRAVVPTEAVTA